MLGAKILSQVCLASKINIPSMTLTQSSQIPECSPGKASLMDCHPPLSASISQVILPHLSSLTTTCP